MTRGERGGDPEVRTKEFELAMNSWGFGYEVRDFADLELIFTDLKTMVIEVEEILRRKKISVVVSFDPREVTFGFDHPDHNRTGEIARIASSRILGSRPKLLFWTSRGKPRMVEKQMKYWQRFYPSQYQDRYGEILKVIGEKYIEVR
jgi:LmbE family N-acetylglucosaminyl deacetylase